ncbi:uncharacterized protein LOC110039501 [Phalaenopsis equestris]|uniref:uncharacterized protein LOC110039501 n=1 Tax=Phalaenopsis equestris TaxID=78828 RepID=UPI0009E5E367|nr:uncharacterized protein LOC110039501 [Phalaenopsis equestris]
MLLRSRLILLKPQPSKNLRFSAVRLCSGSAEPSSEKMEKSQEQQKPAPTNGNTMSDSFGHEYATRSEEEGFGGIYGSNQSLKKNGEDESNPYSAEKDDGQGRGSGKGEKARNDGDNTAD